MTNVRKITHLPGFTPATSEPKLAYYAAVINVVAGSLVVCRHENVPAVVDRLGAAGVTAAIIVPTRLCTKLSMIAEAQRTLEALPLIADYLINISPTHEHIVASRLEIGREPILTIAPSFTPNPPAAPAAHAAPIVDLVAAVADVGLPVAA